MVVDSSHDDGLPTFLTLTHVVAKLVIVVMDSYGFGDEANIPFILISLVCPQHGFSSVTRVQRVQDDDTSKLI